jgi:hypothetical protein
MGMGYVLFRRDSVGDIYLSAYLENNVGVGTPSEVLSGLRWWAGGVLEVILIALRAGRG